MNRSNKNLTQAELEDLLEHLFGRMAARGCNNSHRHTLEWALWEEKYLEDVLRFVAPHGVCRCDCEVLLHADSLLPDPLGLHGLRDFLAFALNEHYQRSNREPADEQVGPRQ